MGEQSGKNQYLATLVVNLYVLGSGIFQAWSLHEFSYYFQNYRAEVSSFSLSICGQAIGWISFSFITMKVGRKIPLLLMPILMIICCVLNLCGRNYYFYNASMVLAGIFGGAVYVVTPLYLLEVSFANDRFRGAILTSFVLPELASFLLIRFLPIYQTVVALPLVISLTVIAAVSIYFFPDTPQSLVKRNKIQEAEESIRFYKNIRKTEAHQLEILQELAKIKNTIAYDGIESNRLSPLRWGDFKTKHALKSYAIATVLLVLSACYLVFQTLVSFGWDRRHRMSSLEENAFYTFIVSILGAAIALQLVDHVGRKALITSSAIGASVGYLAYGIYPLLFGYTDIASWHNIWIPFISSHSITFFSWLGASSLTFTIIVETLPDKIKDIGLPACYCFGFILSKIFEFSATFIFFSVGEYLVMFVLAIISSAAAIIMHFKMPETKGKSRQEITKLF